jgi:hypothetical protein
MFAWALFMFVTYLVMLAVTWRLDDPDEKDDLLEDEEAELYANDPRFADMHHLFDTKTVNHGQKLNLYTKFTANPPNTANVESIIAKGLNPIHEDSMEHDASREEDGEKLRPIPKYKRDRKLAPSVEGED